MYSSIKVTSVILENKIDKLLHPDSKTPVKVFETSNDINLKLAFDLTSKPITFEPVNFYCLDEPSCLECLKELSYFDYSEKFLMCSFKSKPFFNV